VAIAVGLLGLVVPSRLLLTLGGLALIAFAAHKVATRFRHPRWVGMRVRPYELVPWSFLMATAHGAGLMLVPVLARLRGDGTPAAMAASGHAHHMTGGPDPLAPALAAVAVHTAAMLLAMGTIALVVYRKLGVEVLRRAWINLDLIWVGGLVTAGGITLGLGLWPLLDP
jgi:hypothetical protein